MIRDTRPLEPTWSPRDLHHRDGDLDHLASALAPVSAGHGVRPVLITGPPGVGKSTLAEFAVRELDRQTFGLRWGRVDCLARSSTGAILNAALHDAGLGAGLPLEGTPTAEYYERLRACEEPVVLILDEVAHCEDRSVVAALADCRGVTPILITTDDTHLMADVDTRTGDRLREATHVPLSPYSQAALVDILDARQSVALAPGTLADGVIEACADAGAGNARLAIGLLGTAVKQVSASGRSTVEVADVEAAEGDALASIVDRRISDLGTHQRVLFEVVREAGTIDAATLHARYEARVDEPRVRRTRQRYLAGLESYGLVACEGNTKARRYRLAAHGVDSDRIPTSR